MSDSACSQHLRARRRRSFPTQGNGGIDLCRRPGWSEAGKQFRSDQKYRRQRECNRAAAGKGSAVLAQNREDHPLASSRLRSTDGTLEMLAGTSDKLNSIPRRSDPGQTATS